MHSPCVFDRSLDGILSLKQGTPNTPFSLPETPETHVQQPQTSVDTSVSEDTSGKRRLRSHKTTEENEFIFDFGAVQTKNAERFVLQSQAMLLILYESHFNSVFQCCEYQFGRIDTVSKSTNV